MNDKTILITGAAGFIGSCMIQYLNTQCYTNLVIVDDFSIDEKKQNWETKKYLKAVERSELFAWLAEENPEIDFVIHLGARTDTTEFDYSIHEKLNVEYSKQLWEYCTVKSIPLIYASSAATYGSGELGYDDNHEIIEKLQPLNPYGISKNEFDKWAVKENAHPSFWAGLKFFNVYGPNEYHKGRMASVIWHSFNQIKNTGTVKLFKSHRHDFKDGEQLRDFVYIIDLLKVICWIMQTMLSRRWPESNNGLYNLGTGNARTFYDLVASTYAALEKEPAIIFIDMPEDIRDKYQYFTEANMQKLYDAGYPDSFFTLEEGVGDYVKNYLLPRKFY